MPTKTTPGTPRWADRRNDRGARYAGHCGNTKSIARAMGYGTPRYAQAVAAGDKTGPPQRTLEWLDGMIEGRSTNPWPLVAGQVEHVHARDIAPLPDEMLRARWLCACQRESVAQGSVDLIQLKMRQEASEVTDEERRKLLTEIRDLAAQQASALLELSALADEKLERAR